MKTEENRAVGALVHIKYRDHLCNVDRDKPRQGIEFDSPQAQNSNGEENGTQPVESVSFVELKALAEKLLPRDSNLRMLIVAEPDALPRGVGLAKVEVFSRLLYKELENQ